MMLLTKKQTKYLEAAGENKFKFIDNGTVSDKEKDYLFQLDADFFEVYQHHVIVNYKELKTEK